MQRLVGEVIGVDDDCRDREVLAAAVATVARLRGWLDGRDVRVGGPAGRGRRLVPSRSWPSAARTSTRDADRVLERARTVEAIPALGAALDNGTVDGGHVDAVGRVLRQLEPCHRDDVGRVGRVAGQARCDVDAGRAAQGVDGRKHGRSPCRRRDEPSRPSAAGHPARHVDRRRRPVVPALAGSIPRTGRSLHSRLSNTVAALFADKTPDDCPFHPLERQAFLRAHALAALTEGHGTRSAVPEIVAVLDVTDPQPDGSPTVDWGLPVELPADVLRRLFDTADTHPIIVRGGVVLHAPGRLNLGRTTRVANRAQRRALRALYPTCAIPGCDTRYDLCQLHHIIWWEHGGPTDLANHNPC